MNIIKRATLLAISVFLFLFLAESVFASEGEIFLRSTTGETYRCWASSIRMQDGQFRISFSCRNLVYPAGENIFSYVAWAQPTDGGNTIRLGVLGLGKGIFTTRRAFTSMFVTTEENRDARNPTGQTVMRGVAEPIAFLEEAPTPTPAPGEQPGAEEPEQMQQEMAEEEMPEELTTREKLFLALRRAGLAALFALVALIGLIFVVTRSRG